MHVTDDVHLCCIRRRIYCATAIDRWIQTGSTSLSICPENQSQIAIITRIRLLDVNN